ncbi:hypothetical protein ACOMHN_049473 [Nucella lapillus]
MPWACQWQSYTKDTVTITLPGPVSGRVIPKTPSPSHSLVMSVAELYQRHRHHHTSWSCQWQSYIKDTVTITFPGPVSGRVTSKTPSPSHSLVLSVAELHQRHRHHHIPWSCQWQSYIKDTVTITFPGPVSGRVIPKTPSHALVLSVAGLCQRHRHMPWACQWQSYTKDTVTFPGPVSGRVIPKTPSHSQVPVSRSLCHSSM